MLHDIELEGQLERLCGEIKDPRGEIKDPQRDQRPPGSFPFSKETVKARADKDPAFRQALVVEAITSMLEGDVEIGKSILRDYVNATIGFRGLAEGLGGDRDP